MLMSFIPAAVALLAIIIIWFYPLTTKRVEDIVSRLKVQRAQLSKSDKELLAVAEGKMTDYADTTD